MGAQFITTEKGEELVVLSRREYDSLLASLGDEEAEDRMTIVLADEAAARSASGEDPPALPAEIAFAILDGASPLRAIRTHRGWTLADIAHMSQMPADLVSAMDEGTREPDRHETIRLGQALGVDPRWLEPL